MTQDQPYLERQPIDERMIVEEMMRDQHSERWEVYYQFVRRCVYARAKNMFDDRLDDMVQEIMYKVTKYLPHFRFQCSLKTWLNAIIEHHIVDEYRKWRNEKPHLPFSTSPPGETDTEGLEGAHEVVSTEEAFEIQEKIRLGQAALLEYANTHANPVRNWHIIWMVCYEGKTYEEAAIAAGCSAPVVGYVVREAQRYARERWEDYGKFAF